MHSLSKIAVLVVLVVVFFALLTQRILVANENSKLSHDLFSFLFDSSSNQGNGEKLAPRAKPNRHGNPKHHTVDRKHGEHSKHANQTINPITPNKLSAKNNGTSTGTTLPHKPQPAHKNQHSSLPATKNDEIPKHETSQETQSHYTGQHHHKAHQGHAGNHTRPAHRRKHPPLSKLHEPIKHNYHPNISPRIGTDISPKHHEMLIRCRNQTRCIVPDLQLRVKLRVYFCRKPVRSGARFYYLVKEGLLNHPNVELVSFDEISTADLIFFLPASSPWHLTECTNKSFAEKLVVLDEFDGHSAYLPYKTIEEAIQVYGRELNWYLTYFKRSYVTRVNGVFMNYPHLQRPHFYPLVYSLAEMYIAEDFHAQREIDILCTLRGHKGMRTRLRASEWVQGYYNRSIELGKQLHVVLGQADTGTRVDVSKLYFENMYNTKIIVTVNPSEWEGDFRLWESMASGALVFVDPVFVPHEYPLIHGVHVIYFDNQDRNDLWTKLDYYLAHPQEARKIAVAGYLHAMKHHRTVSMVDYFMRTTHKRLCSEYPEKYGRFVPGTYKYTGQYLHREASAQLRRIKLNNYPGNYTTGLR